MNFTYEWQHQNTLFTLNCNFIEQEELITDAHEADPYTLYVKCTNLEANMTDPNTMLPHRVRGSAELALTALINDPGQSQPIYGTYWRDNVPGTYFAREVIGTSPSVDGPAGFGPPADNISLDGSTFNYSNNNYSFIINGIANVGNFNETQAFQTFWVFIEQMLFAAQCDQGWAGTVDIDLEIIVNIPAFDTFAHFQAYIADGDTEGLLNGEVEPIPEPEEYYGRYYVNNLVSNSPSVGQIRYEYYYRFDGPTNCLGFYSEDGKTAKLRSYHGGPSAIYVSDDRGITYEQTGSYPFTFYTESDVSVPLYVLTFKTNIPFFEGDSTDSGKDKLDSYMNGTPAPSGREYTADDAVNRSLIENADIMGKIGDLVTQTTNGVSSIGYTYGVQMFDLSATQKATFLRDILSAARVNDLLDNTKLFGTNQIGALQSLRYFPIDVSEVCTEQSASSCQIGSYTYNFSSSVQQIQQNNKLINMGEQFFRSPYEQGDFRNFEPWCKLYVLLPYAGIHELVISRYINKRVGIKLAVDVTTGACEYHLFASGCEMDSFQGQMGSQIPLTANDKASQVSAVQNGILTSVSGLAQSASDAQQTFGAAGAMMMGGMDAGKALTSGGITPGINALSSGVTIAQGAQAAIRNFLNAPIQTKGAAAGNLGDFGVNSPYFIFAWANSIAPANELNLVGKPSNQGGKVGQFAGYLKCSAFRLANGFTGTAAEAAQIAAQMMEGVYI